MGKMKALYMLHLEREQVRERMELAAREQEFLLSRGVPVITPSGSPSKSSPKTAPGFPSDPSRKETNRAI